MEVVGVNIKQLKKIREERVGQNKSGKWDLVPNCSIC